MEIKSAVENELRNELGGLKPEEAAVLAMLRGRLAGELSAGAARGPSKTRATAKAA
jgi:DNA topoisomerase-1